MNMQEDATEKVPPIPVIRCKQWLQEWDQYPYPEDNQRSQPPHELLLFSMSAKQLRKLAGVYTRRREGTEATGIQRLHEKERSQKIADYVRAGYPYGDLSSRQKSDSSNDTLRKPGWLPTAIVVNILEAGSERRGKILQDENKIELIEANDRLELHLPEQIQDPEWEIRGLPPIEVIDGQHRLFAFDSSSNLPDDFQLPVVAYYGLDVGWQAYLFWSINVSPKKINPSHAYDLFPLLRTQDWLETVSSVHVYREARAQELTDILYRHPKSPWKGRINMLGERKSGWVSQAGWVQGIYNSFLSPGLAGRSRKGLFAANLTPSTGPLDWARPQQAAFLMALWGALRDGITASSAPWAMHLRGEQPPQIDLGDGYDVAFSGPKSLLNQEQGVRGLCLALNDILFRCCIALGLSNWVVDDIDAGETRDEDVDKCLDSFTDQEFSAEICDFMKALANFDWRSSDAGGLTAEEELKKAGFRGTGGYSRLRQELLVFASALEGPLGEAAAQAMAVEKLA
jgi:hypothetical protein